MDTVGLTTDILMTNLINNTDTDVSNNIDIEMSLCISISNVSCCIGMLDVMIKYADDSEKDKLREDFDNNIHLYKELLDIHEKFLRTRKFSKSDKKKIMYYYHYSRICGKDLCDKKEMM